MWQVWQEEEIAMYRERMQHVTFVTGVQQAIIGSLSEDGSKAFKKYVRSFTDG